jgi:alpha-galactosidase
VTPVRNQFARWQLARTDIFVAATPSSGYPERVFKRRLRSAAIATANSTSGVAIATRLLGKTDSDGFPSPSHWHAAEPVHFSADWLGNHADAQRATEVRLLWSPETLFLKFQARFRTITVFPDADPSGRRDHLWDRDVAEVFLQPDPSAPARYREFEVAPNGMWIDLDIAPGSKANSHSALRRRVTVNQSEKVWVAELALPMCSLIRYFDPSATWRLNFFRVEGPVEPRFYSAWCPTNTAIPNFHVPAAFGYLKFNSKR